MNIADSKKETIVDTILSERKNTLKNIGGITINMLMFIDDNKNDLIKYLRSIGNNTPYTEIETTVHYLNSLIGINSTKINNAVLSVIKDDYNNKCRYSDEHYGQHCTTLCANKIRVFRDTLSGMIEYHKTLLDTLDTEYIGFDIINKWRMDIEIEMIDHICSFLNEAIWNV